MVRKEIWMCLLAYNLIRRSMLQAATESNRSPRQLIFTAAIQKIAACWMVLLQLDEERRIALITRHLSGLIQHRMAHRHQTKTETTQAVDQTSKSSPRRTARRELDLTP